MKLATVISTAPLEVIRAGETTAVPVSITAVPAESLTVGDQVQVDVVSRQLLLFARTGGASIPPPAGSVTFSMLDPSFYATLDEAAGQVILAEAAVQAGMIDVDAVGTDNIIALSITGAKVVADTIQGSHIASFSITAADAVFQAAAIMSADIDSLAVNKLSAGSLGVAQYIQSIGYVAGASGWRISADGSLEANSGTFRGTVSAATIIGGTITSASISGTTITGGTFQTAASGPRVVISSGGAGVIDFYNTSGVLSGTISGRVDWVGGGNLRVLTSLDVTGTLRALQTGTSIIATAQIQAGSLQLSGGITQTNIAGTTHTGAFTVTADLTCNSDVSVTGALTLGGSLTLSSGLVTRGAVDSGGAGFRLLRVPNV